MAELTGQIGIRRFGTTMVTRGIEWATNSHTHHVIVAVSETLCVSAEPGGTRYRLIADYPSLDWSRFDLTDTQRYDIVDAAHALVGRPYNYAVYPPLLWQKLTGHKVDGRLADWLATRPNEDCSQLAVDVYKAADIHLFPERSVLVSPGDFERLYVHMGWLDRALSPAT